MMRTSLAAALTAQVVLSMACSKSGAPAAAGSAPTAATASGVALNAAGSTFIYPLMSRWSAEYQKVDPQVRVNYQSIGSGGGIRQLIAKTVQFGATDGPMTDQQLQEAKAPVLHVPLAMGAVVPTYNLPSLAHPIHFTAASLAGIFLGKITTWNDPALASANADLTLPATPIVVVHRSDGSGTTFVWTDYLAKVSPEWKAGVGTATSVKWPTGLGGRGNEGVAGMVEQTPGALGYVELTYAIQNKMPRGMVINHAGQLIEASIDSITAAAASMTASVPEDLRYSITDAPGEKAWPISGTTWAVLYQGMPAGPEREGVLAFLRWAIHDGQHLCAALDYAPLPAGLVAKGDAKLNLVEPRSN